MKTYKIFAPIMVFFLIAVIGCNGDGVFLFSLEDDKQFGAETDAQIEADPSFNILPESSNQQAYAYLNEMKNIILNSGNVTYKDEFVWELHIIDDDATLNAFATPGGYIYVYTGLIHYLDDASSLAGVMGHEIGHADRRHSVKQIQKNAAVGLLLSAFVDGDSGALTQLAAQFVTGLTSLKFSRSDETDADDASVDYLCNTVFEANGAANFFQKIIDEGNPTQPQFLSTHPNPDNRVQSIQDNAIDQGCSSGETDPMVNGMSYVQFQALL